MASASDLAAASETERQLSSNAAFSSLSDSKTMSNKKDVECGSPSSSSSFWSYLNSDVDPAQSTGPLAAFCFMTGYMYVVSLSIQAVTHPLCSTSRDVISFSSIFVWCGFQTGNFAQVCFWRTC